MNNLVNRILHNYSTENPGVRGNLARLLNHGAVGGSGKLLILAVDQGFEHGPGRSFAMNPDAYDPNYHFDLAIEGGFSAYAAPLGWLEAGIENHIGQVPTILKINSSNAMIKTLDQAVTASIDDALRLGCSAIGFTIYPGSEQSLDMFEELRELSREAKAKGLAVVVWSYARGNMTKDGETSLNAIAYGAHMASLLGANIIKVKIPTDFLLDDASKAAYVKNKVAHASEVDRIKHIVQACFNGRRMVIFSGGETKDVDGVLTDAIAIKAGDGSGSIIGRNCFQRPKEEALEMLRKVVKIYNE